MAGVGVQPRWFVSPSSASGNSSSNSNGRFSRIKMAVTSVNEKKKDYTLQKSEEAFNKAKVLYDANYNWLPFYLKENLSYLMGFASLKKGFA